MHYIVSEGEVLEANPQTLRTQNVATFLVDWSLIEASSPEQALERARSFDLAMTRKMRTEVDGLRGTTKIQKKIHKMVLDEEDDEAIYQVIESSINALVSKGGTM